MEIKFGAGRTKYGPGVEIRLTGDEVASAIDLYLYSQGVIVRGARTITYAGDRLRDRCKVYVDPSGSAMHEGVRWTGRGEKE